MSEEKPLNIPEYLLLRSAEARAKALGISVEQALADIKGVPVSEVSIEEPVLEEEPIAEVEEEPVVEEEVVEEPVAEVVEEEPVVEEPVAEPVAEEEEVVEEEVV